MPWLSDLSRHFKLYCSNLIFSPLVGANIAYVLNARGILALPSFGKRVSSFTLLWQHSSSATTTTQPFIQFPREVIVNSISRGSKANWDLHDRGNCLQLASNYLKPRLVMRWQKLKKKYPPENLHVPPHVLIVFYGVQNSAGTSNVQPHIVRTFFFSFGLFRPRMHCFGEPS